MTTICELDVSCTHYTTQTRGDRSDYPCYGYHLMERPADTAICVYQSNMCGETESNRDLHYRSHPPKWDTRTHVHDTVSDTLTPCADTHPPETIQPTGADTPRPKSCPTPDTLAQGDRQQSPLSYDVRHPRATSPSPVDHATPEGEGGTPNVISPLAPSPHCLRPKGGGNKAPTRNYETNTPPRSPRKRHGSISAASPSTAP